jgi:heat shock protein HslJ
MQTLIFLLLIHGWAPSPTHYAVPAKCIEMRAVPVADTNSLNGQWFLQPLLSSDTATGKIPELRINLSSASFSGNTGCNTMRGSLQKTDTSLVFDQNIITTKMNCTGYNEAAFLKNLLRTNRYKFEKGVLILMFDATELSRWTRKPDRKIKINKA